MINQRETAEKAEIARLDGIKRKGVVFHHDVNFFFMRRCLEDVKINTR